MRFARIAQRLAAATVAAWLFAAAPALASQGSLVTPSSPLPMTGLATFLNAAFLSLGSCNSGNSAPANGTGSAAFAGECWINTSANPWVFSYTADAVHWSEFGTLNTSTFAWVSYSNGSALDIGTSGATIPLNNGGFTQSGTANFSGAFQIGGVAQTFPGSGLLVGTTDTQTLSGKTLTLPTINGGALSGTLSGTPTLSGANFITRANLSQVAASSLSGNPTGSLANESAITLGSTLNFSGTTLNCTAMSATQVGCGEPDNSTIVISGGKMVAVGSAATAITALTTTVSGTFTSGDFLGSTSSGCSGTTPCLADTGIAAPALPSQYAYPYYGAPCLTIGNCAGVPGMASGQFLAYLNANNQWQETGTIGEVHTDTNGIDVGYSPITISGTISGKTWCLVFTSTNLAGSPITICYTAVGGDTAATAMTALCAAVVANTTLSSPTTGLPIICDPTQGGGNANLQYDQAVTPITVTTTGSTGTLTLPSQVNGLDGVFRYWSRHIASYTLKTGDGVECDIHTLNSVPGYQQCWYAVVGGATPTTAMTIAPTVAANQIRTIEIGNGVILDAPSGVSNPPFETTGTLDFPLVDGGGIFFGGDAEFWEGSTNKLDLALGTANVWQILNSARSAFIADYGASTAGAWSFNEPFYLNALGTGTATKYLCLTAANQVVAQTAACP